MIAGEASFVDPNHLTVRGVRRTVEVEAAHIVIAAGTAPAPPPGGEFDYETIISSDGILRLKEIPRTMTVVGGGVIGVEYASMFAALGVEVTVVEKAA